MKIKLAFLIGLLPSLALAGEAEEARERVRELDRRCIEERTEALKPLQAQKIEECIAKGKDPAYCERFYKNYGWGPISLGGVRAERFFDDLPVCIEAFEARKALNAK
jgi:hypothetical protein